jgi:nitronate monooxygenase
VSRAGGRGILAGLVLEPDELRRQIARVRELTHRPFGVNLWLHEALEAPPDPAAVPQDVVDAAQDVLNRFRMELGLPATKQRPPRLPDRLAAQFAVVIEERVPVFSAGLGDPGPERVARCREHGIRVMAMACTVGDAKAMEASGVDVIVAQGAEAGGHRSTPVKAPSPQAAAVGTMVLVPEVVDAVRVPVVAAGGVADGRGIVAALALGARGVLLGTRFVATKESIAAQVFKQRILNGTADLTRITDVFTGLYARGIVNSFVSEYEASRAPLMGPLLQRAAARDVYTAATKRGDAEHFPMLAGQSMGLIHDLPSAGDVVRSLVDEATRVLDALGG